MVYKKYIKKDGKLYGPYHYHSYRDENGNVKTSYRGSATDGKSRVTRKSFLLALLMVGIALILFCSVYFSVVNLPEKQLSATSEEVNRGITGFASKFYSFITGFFANEDSGDKEDKIAKEEQKAEEKEVKEEQKAEEKVDEVVAELNETIVEIISETVEVINETIGETNETAETPVISVEEPTEEPAESAKNETSTICVYGVVCGEWSDACIGEHMERECTTTYADCSTTLMIEKEKCTKVYEMQQEEAKKQKEKEKFNETELEPELPQVLNNTFLENITEIVVNETIELNATIEVLNLTEYATNVSTLISTMQYGAKLGIPVKWKKNIDLQGITENETKIISVELPNLAGNISVMKIDEQTGEETELEITTTNENDIEEIEPTVVLTGGVIAKFFRAIFSMFVGITGRAVDVITNADENVTVKIEEVVDENTNFAIEYYTEAPYAEEILVDDKDKLITVIGPDSVHYENILAFSKLPSELADANMIKLYRVNNETKQAEQFVVSDSDNNSLYDTIEWIVPGLSEQIYEIILITKAEHLDESRVIISDIYEEVKEQDGVWSEEIPYGHFVRVIFEKELDSSRDITIFARSTNYTSDIEVYLEDENESITTIQDIGEAGWYKTYLAGLNRTADTFDLRIVSEMGGSVEFDYILDPLTCPAGMSGTGTVADPCQVTSCGILNASGLNYTLQNNLTGNIRCLNITANNIAVDLNGFNITGGLADPGGTDETLPDTYAAGIYIHGANYTTLKHGRIHNFGGFNGANILVNYGNNVTVYNLSLVGGVFSLFVFPSKSSIGHNLSKIEIMDGLTGVYLGNISDSDVSNIICDGTNTGGSYCVFFNGGHNNRIFNLNLTDTGIGLLLTNSSSNIINNINVTIGANDGVDFDGNSWNNTITNVYSSSFGQHGIYLETTSGNTLINITSFENSLSGLAFVTGCTNNTLTKVNLSSQPKGVYFVSNLAASHNTNNTLNNVTVFNTTDGVYMDYTNKNNIFNSLIVLSSTSHDLTIDTANGVSNETLFKDSAALTGYSILGVGTKLTFSNSTYGEIKFLKSIYGNGTNLFGNSQSVSDIVIRNNSVYINSSQIGLNVSANITLYGVRNTYINPAVHRDGVACPPGICYNFTSLNAGTVIFNVTGWSNYSIGDIPKTSSMVLNSSTGRNYANDNLNCYANISDTDNAQVYANYSWFKNGALMLVLSERSSPVTSGSFNNFSTLTFGNLTIGDSWICSILGFDNSSYESGWINSSAIQIVAGCGDGSCNNRETCNDCQDDCGTCGGGGTTPPAEEPPAEEPPVEEPPVEEPPVEEPPVEEPPAEEPETPPTNEQVITLRETTGLFGSGTSCSSSFKCQQWGECAGEYSVSDLISGTELEGKQTRLCVDMNGCKSGFIETKTCTFRVPVIIETKEWCNEKYIEVRKADGEVLARLKKGDYGTKYLGVSLSLVGNNYCEYCYNSIQDYDESGVDCGGSCISCEDKKALPQIRILAPNFDYLIWLILFLVLLMLTLAYTTRNIIIAHRTGEIDDLWRRYKMWKAQGYDVSVLEHHIKEHLRKYGA